MATEERWGSRDLSVVSTKSQRDWKPKPPSLTGLEIRESSRDVSVSFDMRFVSAACARFAARLAVGVGVAVGTGEALVSTTGGSLGVNLNFPFIGRPLRGGEVSRTLIGELF